MAVLSAGGKSLSALSTERLGSGASLASKARPQVYLVSHLSG